MNTFQKLLHSPEIQEKLLIKSAHIKMDATKKYNLGNAYFKLYFGLSCMNWTNKKNLGTAWQTSLTQIKNIINARDKNNPATKFLEIMHETHKSVWPRHIMTHPQRDAVFNGNVQEMREYAVRNVRSAMGEITLLSSQCKIELDKDKTKSIMKQPVQVETQTDKKPLPMSVDAKHQEAIPQTRNGEQVIAKPGVNSSVVPQKETAVNSKQIAVRNIEKARLLSQEAKDKEFAQQIKKSVKKPDLKPQFQQASGKVTNLAEIIRIQMLMQSQQKVA